MTDEVDAVVLSDEIIGELSDEDPLERTVFYALDEAATKLDEQGAFEPFLIILQGEEMFIEELEGDDEEEIFASARRSVFQMDNIAEAYVLTYDGFVDLEDGPSDSILLEYAARDDATAKVLAWLYEQHDGHIHLRDPLYSLGESPTMFAPADEESADVDKSGADVDKSGAEADGSAADSLADDGD